MASTYEPIATTTLGSPAASYTFSSISGSYTDLVLIATGTNSVGASINLTFNSDTASNYSVTILSGDGNSAQSARYSNQTYIRSTYNEGWSSGAGNIGNIIFNIQNYSNTTSFKTALMRANKAAGGTGATVGLWRSTSAINAVTLTAGSGSLQTGCTFTLYGILAA
tara:strand:- start:155 stop:652 length:498 start_codon:yes stop_codon:yes gene_type:complete